MKKKTDWLKIVFVAFVITFFGVAVIQVMSYEKPAATNLYENMVNASVVLYGDDNGGSGVFIDDDMILTAAHILENATFLNIELSDGTVLKSSDFYIDEERDIGFISVDANELCIAKLSSKPVQLGDLVYLVGAPQNKIFMFTLTKGIVSHLDRDFPDWNWNDLIQVDADGGPGSSGGPLYSSEGNLVGMYVGHSNGGGQGISLCESAESILEAYQRCKDAIDDKRH